ncbi:MAG: hypothetical protein WBO39_11395, partial [Ferruginibacter sp.]
MHTIENLNNKRLSILHLKYFFLCFSVSVAIPMTAMPQSDSAFQYIKSIKGSFTYFNLDNLDQVYLITA